MNVVLTPYRYVFFDFRTFSFFSVLSIFSLPSNCSGFLRIEMIQLLFLVVLAEGVVALLLMVKIGPLRELTMSGLDQLKMGRGPATMKTVACTMAVILLSSVTSILKIQKRGTKLGTITPMDQVLWRTHLLEASLIGFSLFLGFVIDRLHHYLQKLTGLGSTIGVSKHEVEKLMKECVHLKEKEERASKEITSLQEKISSLKEDLKKLRSDSEEKEKRALSAEASVVALQKQAEDLLLEYDRQLEDNQNLQMALMS